MALGGGGGRRARRSFAASGGSSRAPSILPITASRRPSFSHTISCWYCDLKMLALNDPLYSFGRKHASFLKLWFSLGTAFATTALLIGVTLLLISTLNSILDNNILFAFFPSPSVSVSMSVPDLGYVIFSTLISVAFHEFGHAIAAASEGIQIEYIAIYVAVLFPGALVAFNYDSLQALPHFATLRIYCAGIWHNAVVNPTRLYDRDSFIPLDKGFKELDDNRVSSLYGDPSIRVQNLGDTFPTVDEFDGPIVRWRHLSFGLRFPLDDLIGPLLGYFNVSPGSMGAAFYMVCNRARALSHAYDCPFGYRELTHFMHLRGNSDGQSLYGVSLNHFHTCPKGWNNWSTNERYYGISGNWNTYGLPTRSIGIAPKVLPSDDPDVLTRVNFWMSLPKTDLFDLSISDNIVDFLKFHGTVRLSTPLLRDTAPRRATRASTRKKKGKAPVVEPCTDAESQLRPTPLPLYETKQICENDANHPDDRYLGDEVQSRPQRRRTRTPSVQSHPVRSPPVQTHTASIHPTMGSPSYSSTGTVPVHSSATADTDLNTAWRVPPSTPPAPTMHLTSWTNESTSLMHFYLNQATYAAHHHTSWANSEIHRRDEIIRQHEDDLKQKNLELEEKNLVVESQRVELQEKDVELHGLREDKEQLSFNLSCISGVYDMVTSELDALKLRCAVAPDHVTQQIEDLQKEISMLQKEIATLRSSNEYLQFQNTSITNRLGTTTSRLAVCEDTLSSIYAYCDQSGYELPRHLRPY